ncbi:MAG: hypothetical protein NC453_12490 [Muribaculum sp.]|nr:hypothetical protein [Muribaculum sp.]
MLKYRIPKIDCWKTRILSCDFHPFEKMKVEGDIILELKHFESIKPFSPLKKSITIEADPFLFVNNDRLFLFYESKLLGQNGVIKQTSTSDLQSWTPPETVLVETCHLSYPFVFEDNGSVYMIPETGTLGSIRLYRSTDAKLTSWQYVKTLLSEESINADGIELSFCDSSLLKRQGIWYLFTTVVRYHTNELLLFTSDSLEGPFVQHPLNPIERSNRYGRNAGSVISYDNALWHVSQECSTSYGENVNVSCINRLSPTTYEENFIIDGLFNRKEPFYRNGAHQLNVVRFRDRWIVATDAKGYRSLPMQRLLSKLK